MKWIRITADSLIAALNADILYEADMADDCLRRAGSAPQQYRLPIRNRADWCAAAAVRNATALAAEVLVLGGIPPDPHQRRSRRRAAESIEEYVVHAQSAVTHYQSRLAMAERLGLARLREVFQEIVLAKRRHLAHAGMVAAEGIRPGQLG